MQYFIYVKYDNNLLSLQSLHCKLIATVCFPMEQEEWIKGRKWGTLWMSWFRWRISCIWTFCFQMLHWFRFFFKISEKENFQKYLYQFDEIKRNLLNEVQLMLWNSGYAFLVVASQEVWWKACKAWRTHPATVRYHNMVFYITFLKLNK